MTKKLKLLFVVCFVSIALGLSASNANATSIAASEATALLVPKITPGSFHSNIKSFSGALAANTIPQLDFGLDILPNIVSTSAFAGVIGAAAIGETGFSPFTGPNLFVMHSQAGAAPIWPHPSLAGAAAGFVGDIVARTTTSIGFDLLNALTLNLSTTLPNEHAAGFAFAGVFVVNKTQSILDFKYNLVFNEVSDGGPPFLFSTLGFDTRSVSAGFNPGDVGFWGAVVASGVKAEPVPEPTTMALFGMGMVGLVGAGVRRKFKKKEVEKS